MRAYAFCHHYLKPMLQGLQTAHATNEMGLLGAAEVRIYKSWVKDHKTLIMLNGGFTASLEAHAAALASLAEEWKRKPPVKGTKVLPVCAFREDQETLGGILTSVAIVVPKDIYDLPADQMAEAKAYLDEYQISALDACTQAFVRRDLTVQARLALLLASRPLAS